MAYGRIDSFEPICTAPCAVPIPRGTYTTEALKNLFGVQEGYILEFINHEGQLTPLKPGAKLRVKEGMKFFEQVPCGGSS